MPEIRDLKYFDFLPSESSNRRMLFSVLMYQESLVSVIIDTFIFLINILSIILVLVADVNESIIYRSIFSHPTWVSILDFVLFSVFLFIYLTKIATCSSQNNQELGSHMHFISRLHIPVFLKKILGFMLIPLQLSEFLIICVYGFLFWPFSFVTRNITFFLYLSFYVRCIKMATYFRGGRVFLTVLYRGRRRLVELVFMFVVFSLILGCSAFLAEKYTKTQKGGVLLGSQREFGNILDGIWWSIVTITTTGYGELVPHTILGRFIASIAMITGVLYLAMPISIINTLFETYIIEEEARKENWRAQMREGLKRQRGGEIPQKSATDTPKKALERILEEDEELEAELGERKPSELVLNLLGGEDQNSCLAQSMRNLDQMIRKQEVLLNESKDLRAFLLLHYKMQKREKRLKRLKRRLADESFNK